MEMGLSLTSKNPTFPETSTSRDGDFFQDSTNGDWNEDAPDPLVMTNIAKWKDPPFFLIGKPGKPSINLWAIFHSCYSYVSSAEGKYCIINIQFLCFGIGVIIYRLKKRQLDNQSCTPLLIRKMILQVTISNPYKLYDILFNISLEKPPMIWLLVSHVELHWGRWSRSNKPWSLILFRWIFPAN